MISECSHMDLFSPNFAGYSHSLRSVECAFLRFFFPLYQEGRASSSSCHFHKRGERLPLPTFSEGAIPLATHRDKSREWSDSKQKWNLCRIKRQWGTSPTRLCRQYSPLLTNLDEKEDVLLSYESGKQKNKLTRPERVGSRRGTPDRVGISCEILRRGEYPSDTPFPTHRWNLC